MVFIPSGFANVSLEFDTPGPSDPVMCTYGVDNTALALTPADIGINAETHWNSHLRPETGTAFSLIAIHITPGPSGATSTTLHTVSPALPGTGSAAGYAVNTAFLLAKQTARPGRKGRGRMFYLPPGESGVDASGTVAAGTVSNMNTALTNWLGAHSVTNIPVVLLHTNPLDSPDPVTSMVASSLLGTIGRRLR